jgi:hypothetical protein
MPNWSIWWEWRSDAKCHIICCVNWRIYINTMGNKIVLMNLNGNGKMDSIHNILVHWKMLFWARLAIISICSTWKYPKSTKWLFFWEHILWTWLILFCLHMSLPPLWRILFKLGKPFECIMKAWYYLPPKNGMFVTYRSISIWWSPIESWYGILSFIKKLAQI